MSVQEHCRGIQFKDLCDTDAFKRRDKEWPFESWDYTEWEECVEEAKKELTASYK